MNEFQIWLADAISDNMYTPDVPRLETQDFWFVFTYADRRGKSSSYFSNDTEAQYLSIGWTDSAIYSILNVQAGTKNFYLADTSGTDRILGEVWSVPTEMLMDLDVDESNTHQTKRLQVPIKVAKGRIIPAWIYTAHPGFLRNGPVKISKYERYTWYGSNTKFLEIV